MWYDNLNEEWLKDEQDLHELLYEIADDNRDFFDIDDLIDAMEDKRLEADCEFIKNEEKKLQN